MRLKFEHTEERLTRRTGLVLIDRFGKRHKLSTKLDHAFPQPGSNRGKSASEYILTLVEMLIDGAMHLEDVRSFAADDAYQTMTHHEHYPTSDAIGNWLRRHGGKDGEQRLWSVITDLTTALTTERELTLDIDAVFIEANKGDATMSYHGERGYYPLVGVCPDLGVFIGSRFQQGNVSPQSDLVSFLQRCCQSLDGRIAIVRSDSAAYNHEVINECVAQGRCFSITADHDEAVMAMIRTIPASDWRKGTSRDGTEAEYDIAETVHTMHQTPQAFRLVVKRTWREKQADLFDGNYSYWIIATNIPVEEKNTQALIHFHEQRGEAERMFGELKEYYNLNHLPCGQMNANTLYFTIGLLAYNLVHLLKRHYFGAEWKNKSIRSLRYWWLHVAARLSTHARYMIAHVAMPKELFECFHSIYLRLTLQPAPA